MILSHRRRHGRIFLALAILLPMLLLAAVLARPARVFLEGRIEGVPDLRDPGRPR